MIWYLYISIALPHALTLVWNMYHQWHPFPSKEIGKREYFPEPPSVPSSYSCTSLPEYSLTGLASFFHPALTSWFLIYNTGTHTHTHTCVCICVFWAQHLESYISNCHYYDKDKGNTRSYEIAQLEDLILSMGWKMSHIANYASSWYLKTGLTAIKSDGKQNMQNLWHRKASTVF